METSKIKERKEQLEKEIKAAIDRFEADTQILKVDKVYVSGDVVKTELKVLL